MKTYSAIFVPSAESMVKLELDAPSSRLHYVIFIQTVKCHLFIVQILYGNFLDEESCARENCQ